MMNLRLLKTLATCLIVMFMYPELSAQDNPLAWWNFENQASDAGSNGYNAVAVGSPTYDNTDAKEGENALVLDGTADQELQIEYDAFKSEFTQRTFALWFKAVDPSADQILYEEGGTAKGMAIRLNENTIEAQANQEGGHTLNVSTEFTSTEWTHVALVFDAGTLTLYVNGEQVAQNTDENVSAVGYHGDPATIGGTNWGDVFGEGGNFNGKIDDVRVYGLALTSEQVALIFHSPLINNLKKLPDTKSITIDGKFVDWKILNGFNEQTNTKYNLKEGNTNLVAPENAEDLTTTWIATYDDNGIYVMVNVKDDNVQQPDEPSWYHDVVEAYFKIGNGTATPGDIADDCVNGFYQYSFPLTYSAEHEFGVAQECKDMQAEKADWRPVITEDGYMMEFYIAFEGLKDENGVAFDPTGDVPFGFELHVHDNDNTDMGEVNPRTRAYWSLDGQPGSISGGHAWETAAWETGTTGRLTFSGEELEVAQLTNNLKMIPATETITIDGSFGDWNALSGFNEQTNTKYNLKAGNVNLVAPESDEDLTTTWIATYDDNGIYVMVNVTDDNVQQPEEPSWYHDVVEAYFKIGNGTATPGDIADDCVNGFYQYSFPLTYSAEHEFGVAQECKDMQAEKADWRPVITEDGYMMEFYIAFEGLKDENGVAFDPTSDVPFGFELHVHDNDNTDMGEVNPRTRAYWSLDGQPGSISGGHAWETAAWETGTTGRLTFSGEDLETAPEGIVIDGEIESAWDKYQWRTMDRVFGYDELTIDNEADQSARWKVSWDQDNLYVLFEVNDDIFDISGDAAFLNDGVGIYLDKINSKAMVYDANHYYIRHVYNQDALSGWQGPATPDEQNQPALQCDYAETVTEGEGYIVEFAISFEDLGITPEIGMMLGIDVRSTDRDGEGTRDQIAWNDDTDWLYRDPYRFGTIELLTEGDVKGYNTRPTKPELNASVDKNSVVCSWEAVDDAVGYMILKDGEVIADTEETTYTVNGLENGVYEFTIAAYAEGKVQSNLSEAVDIEVTGTVVIVAVDDLAATVNENTVSLSWSAVDNAAGYKVMQDGTEIGTTEETTYTVTDLANATYSFTVVAYTAENILADASNEAEATVDFTAINNIAENTIAVYPNPARDVLYIKADLMKTVAIYTIDGRSMLMKQNLKTNKGVIELNIANLQNGMYILLVNDGHTNHVTRFIKN